MRANICSFAYLVVLSGRGSRWTRRHFYVSGQLSSERVWLILIVLTMHGGHVLGLRMSGGGVPSFLDDEGPWAPDRLPAGASSTSLKAALPLENRKRRCVSVEDGRPGKTGAGTENFFSLT